MKVIAYLFYNGNCAEALKFYEKALGAKILMSSKASEAPGMPEAMKDLIMHAQLQIGDSVIYFSDWLAEGKAIIGDNIHISVDMGSVEAVDSTYKKLSEGGKPGRPPENTFWGARFAQLTDKYGVHWMLNHDLKKN